jgi:eukaryotic-like serine/threonine-protein kinase
VNFLGQGTRWLCTCTRHTEAQIADAVEECRIFEQTCDRSWFEDEIPTRTVTLDAFWIMQTEVTNVHYKQCVTADSCTPPDNPTWDQAENSQLPVTHVTWAQADTYAQWAGGRLPTAAEWEKAARGTDGRIYPWGNEWGDNRANYCDRNCKDFAPFTAFDDGYPDLAPVGSYPNSASPYGALDMVGNVFEWTAEHVLRGGALYSDPKYKVRVTTWHAGVNRLPRRA